MTKLYFAGCDCYEEEFKNLSFKGLIIHRLMSYFSLKGKEPPFNNIFLDSGAFTAFTQKKHINITDYCKYIFTFKNKIEFYSNLDVIGDAQKTYDNQKYMEKQGLNPIPCFHVGEDFKWLKRYIDEGYTYIALGGMVPFSRNQKFLVLWLKKCFTLIPKEIKIHGFGITNSTIISQFNFYSIDSSSWLMGMKRGILYKYKNGKIKQLKINKKVMVKTTNWITANRYNIIEWKKYADYLEAKKC